MCGRYEIYEEVQDEQLNAYIQQATRLSARLCASMKTCGEIRPTDIAPVLAPSAIRRSLGAFPMQWGFRHPTKGMLVFNTRSETAAEKDLFCTSIDERRCLIPASRYFEWHKRNERSKDRYAFYAENRAPLYLAGLYLKASDQQRLPCFSILTRDAAPNIRAIHPRMPVLVPLDRAEEWLSPDTSFHTFVEQLQLPVFAEPDE
jgi:Uncharacterized conserved protein